MVTDLLAQITNNHLIKLIYCVPNFQNPSGISYSEQHRKEIALYSERPKNDPDRKDDPYGRTSFFRKRPALLSPTHPGEYGPVRIIFQDLS